MIANQRNRVGGVCDVMKRTRSCFIRWCVNCVTRYNIPRICFQLKWGRLLFDLGVRWYPLYPRRNLFICARQLPPSLGQYCVPALSVWTRFHVVSAYLEELLDWLQHIHAATKHPEHVRVYAREGRWQEPHSPLVATTTLTVLQPRIALIDNPAPRNCRGFPGSR